MVLPFPLSKVELGQVRQGLAVARPLQIDSKMRACGETVRTAAVWADTTRLHPMGQEGGLSGNGSLPDSKQTGAAGPFFLGNKGQVFYWGITSVVVFSSRMKSMVSRISGAALMIFSRLYACIPNI